MAGQGWNLVRKLEALANSSNPHEAAQAQSLATSLREKLPPEKPVQAPTLYELNYIFKVRRWSLKSVRAKLLDVGKYTSHLKKWTIEEESLSWWTTRFKVYGLGEKLELDRILMHIQFKMILISDL